MEALAQRLERLEAGAPAPAPPPVAPAAPAPAAPAAPAAVAEDAPAAAAPEPRNPPPASGDGLMARWEDAVLPEVGRRSPPLRALLDHARPTGVDEGVVTLAFSLSFARSRRLVIGKRTAAHRGARPGAGRPGQGAARR